MIRWLMAAVAMTLASGAFAQGVREALYIGGAGGSSKFTYDTGSLPIANTTATTFSVNDDSDTAFKIFGGWRFNRYFAAEVGIVEFGTFSATRTVNGTAGSARSEIDVAGVSFDAVGIAPIGDVVELFGKVGALAAGVHAKRTTTGGVTIGGATSSDDTVSSTSAHVAAGLNFRVTSRVWLRVEYERAYKVGDPKVGEGDVSAFTVGAAYHF